MASPQKENGFTPIANELVEAICTLNVSGTAHRVLRYIERKTYGFHKKKDMISLSQFVEVLNTDRRTITRAIEELEKQNIIKINRGGFTNEYYLNKDYDTWVGGKTPLGGKMAQTRGQNAPKTRGQNAPYKRYKETKDISKQSLQLSEKDMAWKNKASDNDDDLPSIDMDSQKEISPKEKPKRHYKEVYDLFKTLGPIPLNWTTNTTQQNSAENLYTERGVEQIISALQYYKEHKGEEYLPEINSPWDLDSKWKKLHNFKKKNG